MKEITYDQAFKLSKTYKDKDKITFILFKDENCPYCNDFIPNVIEKMEEEHSNDIDFYIVPSSDGNPFPPSTTPITYIYVPGKCKNKMPLIRPGTADRYNVNADLLRAIQSKNEGLNLDESRFPMF